MRLTFREKSAVYETRNVIRFRDYQKFGTEIKILDEDVDVPAEDVKKPDQLNR